MSSCPLIRGNPAEPIIRRGHTEYSTRGVVYVSSIIANEDHVRIFYGIDDVYFSSSVIARKKLDKTWLSIR
jgi:hypothetical protein